MTQSYEVRASPGKGYGLFATRYIPAGTLILADRHVMVIAKEGGARQDPKHDIQHAFEQLGESQIEQFLSLHAGPEDGRRLVERIYTTNRFGDFESTYMCLTISRINHACIPNAASTAGETDDEDSIRAIAPIKKGDEICISYRSDLCWIMTRVQRQALLQSWNFDCQCPLCDLPSAEIDLSDFRRKFIFALRWNTVLEDPVDLSHYDSLDFRDTEEAYDTLNEPNLEPLDSISLRTITAYQLLLAHALEAERIDRDLIGKAYYEAAIAHFADLAAMAENVLVLQWGRNVRDWMEKAIQLTSDFYGFNSDDAQQYRNDWKTMQLLPQLALLLDICDLPTTTNEPIEVQDLILQKLPTRAVHDDDELHPAFALLFLTLPGGRPAVRCIDETECRNFVREQCLLEDIRSTTIKERDAFIEQYKLVVEVRENLRSIAETEGRLNALFVEEMPGL
ncbi:hypothetical protein DOTSEDRAFT_54407 [Dothistroma septosporum NZE10]|uniref:SET domain-containing protein n=1 Tax=Dothistroma septosporum (strain NZE10 / CBS 128990) TaxID=675120 RepID=M2Y5W7_DOTSN|nr:hypothetical protein DOTSEDRAFT_54407 [Dothistroma septosporum NZE10]